MVKNNIPLSVIILTKDAEQDIEACIQSASFAKEIIVIDSNSTDNTVHLAKKNGAAVVSSPFRNFSDQREKGLKLSTHKWVLYIDADERVTSGLAQEIERAIESDEVDCYRIGRKNIFYNKYEWPGQEKMERLFRKESLSGWRGAVHESPVLTHNTIRELSSPLLHFTHKNLESMVDKTVQWSKMEAELIVAAKHPLMREWRFIRIMLTKFVESYVKKEGWKKGTAGLLEAIYQSYSYFIIYAVVWEEQQKRLH